ncbi:hypothetical protein DAERI_140128 [Deinococcus aerius]|uniref:Uncharacterized protein n=1 Tax=Deinococcus aerius TaxID=200253 RepID=A0A2I9DWP9_9DEIO|nr:SEL1-like repeat protein [Deinococcus aerius]GBF07467.1 hypothetical protein DAERI_140128 [Deinococcus aerius]
MAKPIDVLVEKANRIMDGTHQGLEDWRDALQIYEQAGSMGSGEAFFRLGQMYDFGKGPKQNIEKAIANYKKAAQLGEAKAYAGLVTIYGHLKDYQNGRKIFSLLLTETTKPISEKRTVDLVACFISYVAVMRFPDSLDKELALRGLPYAMRGAKDMLGLARVTGIRLGGDMVAGFKTVYSLSQSYLGKNEKLDEQIASFQNELTSYLSSNRQTQ